MTKNNKLVSQHLTNGYQPKPSIVKVIQGQAVQVPLAQLSIKPPQGGTGVVTPKK